MPVGVHLDRRGIVFDDTGECLPLYSGAVHYWRLDPASWRLILTRVQDLGFRCIETYVPWSVHEVAPGEFDFSGHRDVDAFLRLCGDLGLYAIVRPGPHINAEITYFGYPERIISNPANQAKTASGGPSILGVLPTPFPIPSYCPPSFFDEVQIWFDAVCPILARHQYPDGRVVLVQVDNELSYFFKLTPYDVDYHPAARAHYQQTLRDRYGDIATLNAAYGAEYSAFDAIDAPDDFQATDARELPRYLDWAAAKERYISDGLMRVRDMLRARGIDRVPLFHNAPREHRIVPFNQVQIEQVVDVQGIDSYHYAEEYDTVKRLCLYLAGTSRLPFIPEFGAGTWLAGRMITELDAETCALCALMHGVKAFNYYMLVERERWLGCAIGRRGDVREPEAGFFRKLLRFLETSSWSALERKTDVLLLYARDYERHAFAARLFSPPLFSYLLGPFSGLGDHEAFADKDLGLGCIVPRVLREWWNGCYTALTESHFGFALGDTECDTTWLQSYRTVVCPGFAYLSRPVQERLAAYAQGGGTLVMGPELPRLDALMQPCDLLKHVPASRLHVLPKGAEIAATLTALGVQPAAVVDNRHVDTVLFTAPGRTVVVAANTTDTVQAYSLSVSGARQLRGVWQSGVLAGNGVFHDALPAYRIHVWEAE